MGNIYILLAIFFIVQIAICVKSYKNGLLMFWGALLAMPSTILLSTISFVNIFTISSIITCMAAILNQECNKEMVYFIKSYSKTILILIGISLLCTVLAETVPLTEQLFSLFKETWMYIVIFITFFTVKNDIRFTKQLFICVLFGICFNVLYCILFELVLRENPCGAPLSLLLKTQLSTDMINTERGMFDFRLQSIFGHPLSLGQYMLILYPVILLYGKHYHGILYKVILFAIPIVIFLTGSRSAYVPLLLLIACYVLFITPRHSFFTGTIFFLLTLLIYLSLSNKQQKTVDRHIESTIYGIQFWDENKQKKSRIYGSSMKLRLNQYDAALYEIKNNPWFGRGIHYREWYQNKYRRIHPKLLGYESVVLLHIVERGIIGFVLTLYIVFCMCFYFVKNAIHNKKILYLLYGCYLLSVFMTGIRPFSLLLLGLCSSLACKPFFNRYI